MGERIEITINAEEVFRVLQQADAKIEETEEKADQIIDEVDKRTADSFDQVLNMARSSYLIGMGMVKAMGGSISYMFRSMVSAMFTSIHALKALALGKAMTTQDWFSFAMEMGQLGLAISATIAADMDQQALGRRVMGAKMSLMGLQSMIGAIGFQ